LQTTFDVETPSEHDSEVAARTDVCTASATALAPRNVGTTVPWKITGVAHDVTFSTSIAGTPASIPVTTNAVISRTFNTKGSFPYDCRTHPGMSGNVTVQ